MTYESQPRPFPLRDLDNESFWEGTTRSELRLQRCTACDRHRFPPMLSCPYCGELRSEVSVSLGCGVLYSYVVAHHAFSSAFTKDVPYTIGTVDLDEGCRMLGRLELGSQPAVIGMRLGVAFRRHEAKPPESAWNEPYFVSGSQDE
jgi:uncharacterized OB-fold protein